MNMISTGSFRTEANASTKQEELMQVLTAAWEKKNSKAARTGGVSLMALSLAACGGSSEDTTPFDQAHVDAEKALSYDAGYDAGTDEAVELVTGLTTSNNTLTAANAELTTANAELTTTNAELTTANAELTTTNAELTTTNGNLTTANADLTTDIQTANATITTINDTAHATEQAAYNAGETAGAASRDDEVNTLTADLATANSTITAIDNTAHASEQDAYDAGVASLQATVDAYNALVAQNALDAARTIDADGDAVTLSTSGTIIVSGTTAGADTLNATVDAGGNATVIFDFSDAEDTVVLTSADLTGVTAIEVQDGTVDFTAVGSMDGIALTLGSGAVLTAAQATGLASIGAREGAAAYDLTVNVAAGDDIDALTAALTAAGAGGNVTVAADDGVLTPAQSTALAAVSTVENASGGAVVTTNAAPVIADAETTVVDGSTDAVAMTAAASVSDAEGNYDGGTIVISPEAGYLIGEGDAAEGLTIAGTLVASATVPYQYSVVSGSIIATDVNGATMVVGTVVNNGSTTDTTAAVVAYSSVQITLNGNATDAIVSDLLTEMRFDGVVDSTAGAVDEATVTVTVTDAAGASTSFARLVDSDGATTIANLENDSREVEAATLSAGMVYDNGGNAAITNNGLDYDGATLTITSSVSGDQIDATPTGYTVTSGNLIEGGAIIGTISGDATDSVTITFNSSANDANVDAIIQGATITGSGNGAHVVTTTLTEATGDSSVSHAVTLTVVGDFGGATGIGTNAGVAAGTSAAPVPLLTLLNVADTANAVTLNQNTYIEIDNSAYGGAASQDLQAQIDAGYVVIGDGVDVVRLVTNTGAATSLNAVSNLNALGSSVVWYEVDEAVTLSVAQASGATINATANVIVSDLEANLAADLSGIEATGGGAETAALDSNGGVTFTGDLGNFALTVTDSDGTVADEDLTIAASVADGKSITTGGNESIIVTGVDGSFEGDLGGVIVGGTGSVEVAFATSTTLHADAQIDSANLAATVAADSTLTLSASQADAIAAAGGAVGSSPADGTLGSVGGTIIVTVSDMDSDTSTDTVELESLDLSALTAGTGAAGGYAGALNMTLDQDVEITGTTNFGTASVASSTGSTVSGTATALDGLTIGGSGNFALTNLEGDLSADFSNLTTTAGTSTVSVSGVQETQTITVADSDGDDSATGAVTFMGSVVAGSANLDSIEDTIDNIIADKSALISTWNTANPGAEIADLAKASASTITVTYKATEGDVANNTLDTASSTITFSGAEVTAGDVAFTSTAQTGAFTVNVDEGVTLTLAASAATGKTIVGAATSADSLADTGGSIAITGLSATEVDLAGISAGAASEAGDTAGSVTFTGDINSGVTLNAATDLGNASIILNDGTGGTDTLTLSAAQASGRAIVDNANESLVITGLANDTDLSGINLSGSGGITIQLADEGVVDISSNADFLATDAGDTATAIALTDSTLTATAEQLNGATVTGQDGADDGSDNGSSVVLTGGIAAATGGNTSYDITGLNDTSVDLTIAAGYTLSNFTETDGTVRSAILTADAVHLAGQSVSGTGTVVGTAFDATAAGDYSGLTATTAQLQLAADATLSSSANVGTATIVLDSDAAGAGTGDDSLSVTVSQAASLNVADGGGNGTSNLTITGTVTADEVDYSATDWDVDTLTINLLSGDNVVTGAQNVASNIITTGANNDTITTGTDADVLTGGAGSDLFDVNHGDANTPAAVTIQDFTTGTDFLDLDVAVTYVEADGAAVATVGAFLTAAGTSFGSGTTVYVQYDHNNGGNGYLVSDDDGSGDISAGDTLILLTGVGAANAFGETDII